jgi:hypothetical protein
MKLISVLFLTIVFAVSGAAQIDCGLTAAPRVFNLSLGMSPEQTQATVGRELKIKVKKRGQRTFFQNFIDKRPPQTLSGVRALYLRFFNGGLYQIEIFYEERIDWKTLEAFSGALSSEWNFPASLWLVEKGKARIDCGELTVLADNVLNPRVEITNEIARAEVEAQRKRKKD